MQYIANRNRLGAGINPTWTNHQWHALRQIADHFKGKAARTNNGGGPKFGDGDTGLAQRFARLLPGTEMFRKFTVGVHQAAEIDNPLDVGLFGGLTKITRRR